jgi:hypothetical protein
MLGAYSGCIARLNPVTEPTRLEAVLPLLEFAAAAEDPALRVAALAAAARLPLDETCWFEHSRVTGRVLGDLPPGSAERRAVLRVAADIPLLSVRRHLRTLAEDPADPDAAAAAAALGAVGDPTRARALAQRIAAGEFELLEVLAAMPLEESDLSPAELPPVPTDADPSLALWRALCLARLEDCDALDAYLTGRAELPPMFWGDPSVPAAAMAAVRPLPEDLHRHLLEALPDTASIPDPELAAMARQIILACTGQGGGPESSPVGEVTGHGGFGPVGGMAPDGAEDFGGGPIGGMPPAETTEFEAEPMGGIMPDETTATGPAEAAGDAPATSAADDAELTPDAAAARTLEIVSEPALAGAVPTETLAQLSGLEPAAGRRLIVDLLEGAATCLHTAPSADDLRVPLGNTVIGAAERMPPGMDWPTRSLVELFLRQGPEPLDLAQFAWLLARDRETALAEALRPLGTGIAAPEDPQRLLALIGELGDVLSDRAGSPWRGAGGGATTPGPRRRLIDDEPEMAMRGEVEAAPPDRVGARSGPPMAELEEAAPSPAASPAEPGEAADQRRVNAQIWQGTTQRTTFLAGAEHIIRCWIGLPDEERAAVADAPIRHMDIPDEGLPLTVQLEWNGQTQEVRTRLPASRTGRTGDCDLKIVVPEDERFVRANVAFLYGNRVFEFVRIEAAVLLPDEEPRARDELQVQVQVQERELIELEDRTDCDATLICETDPDTRDEDGRPVTKVLEFGAQGAARLSLGKTGRAVAWLNKELFIANKNLVRAQQRAGTIGGEPLLDAEDETVLTMLRKLAEHGATFYNELTGQRRFADPGRRIRLMNLTPDEYTPLEFVYDRGYPASDARLCDGWREALAGDADECPCCGPAGDAAESGDRVPIICPLGFWSLRKIIERLDPYDVRPGDVEHGDAARSVPRNDRRVLPPIDHALFGASHRVEATDRAETIAALRDALPLVDVADGWSAWRDAIRPAPIPLLVALPHHGIRDAQDYLEIGGDQTPDDDRFLERGRLVHSFVNPQKTEPGPIVLLIGCETGAESATGYPTLARRFQQLHTSIVVGTLAKILGRHAAPVARELVHQLATVDDPAADFGTIMRRVRRRMLLKGYLMAMCLVALGDGDWHLGMRGDHAPATPDSNEP